MRPVLICAAALLVAPAAAQAGCSDHGGRTVHANRAQTVWLSDSGSGWSCLRATGHRTRLFYSDELYRTGRIRYVAGAFVAFSIAYSPECKGQCPPGVTGYVRTVLFDARSVDRVRLAGEGVPALVLSHAGTAAWLTGQSPDAVLHVYENGARRVLDSGRIPFTSLGIQGRTLHWTSAGRRQTLAVA